MSNLDHIVSPDALGTVQNRYIWDGTRHHVQNHLLTLFCLIAAAAILFLSHREGYSLSNSPMLQCSLTISVSVGAFFMLRAIQDQMLRHVRYLAIVGDRGFSILKYNEENDIVLEEYIQSYDTLTFIEKHERDEVSEDGIYLRTVSRYEFYAPERKFCLKVKFNRHDIRLQERDGMSDVKALMAIESAYNSSCSHASVDQILEHESVIPSHPQPIIQLKAPILWRDLKD